MHFKICMICGKNFYPREKTVQVCRSCSDDYRDKNLSPFAKKFVDIREIPKDTEEIVENKNENEKAFEKTTKELYELYSRKNRDYDNAFGKTFEDFGLISSVIRLNDKLNRLKKLSKTGSQEVKDESIRDTLVDLCNYSIMTIMELDKK